MLELLLLVLRTLVAAVRSRRDVALENLALRHQVEVPLRTKPHSRLRGHDRREVGALRVVSRSPWVVSSRLGAGHASWIDFCRPTARPVAVTRRGGGAGEIRTRERGTPVTAFPVRTPETASFRGSCARRL